MRVDDIALEMNELLHAEDPEAAGAIGVDLNDGIEDLPVYRHRSRNKANAGESIQVLREG